MARGWNVTGQDPTLVLVGSRRVPGVRVSFTDDTGLEDHVDVPDDTYKDPQEVKAAIAARIAQHEAVAALSSGG